MATAYPRIVVDAFDLDAESIAAARRNARDMGVADRVTFSVSDASDPATAARYDLVSIFEPLHDMARPVDALRTARRALRDGGSVLVADERVNDEFTAPAPVSERHAYGWSVISCLPGAMGDRLSAATGAVMRPSTLRRYTTAAGFRQMEVLGIDTGPFQFYRLIP
jgi:ubiquinone/menaquinone biosynthesis C-methylase UbiE